MTKPRKTTPKTSKTSDPDKWIKKALLRTQAEKAERPHLAAPLVTLGTDGHRAHLAPDATPNQDLDAKQNEAWDKVIQQFERARAYTNTVTLTAAHLAALCRLAIALYAVNNKQQAEAKTNQPAAAFCFNGTLEMAADNSDTGSLYAQLVDGETYNGSNLTIHYQHTGPTFNTALNPNYILDALSGLGPVVTIKLGPDPVNPVLFIDPATNRQALIMPLTLRRSGKSSFDIVADDIAAAHGL